MVYSVFSLPTCNCISHVCGTMNYVTITDNVYGNICHCGSMKIPFRTKQLISHCMIAKCHII